jgi:tRNA uridine 5-carboxymethylaminomethyl modification enzyme
MPMRQLIRRPELKLKELLKIAGITNGYGEDELLHVEFVMKYEGYLKRQQELVEKFKKMEDRGIPKDLDYTTIPSLSNESREKLQQIRPASLGQAARISGVRHGDVTVLMILLEKYYRSRHTVSRETF